MSQDTEPNAMPGDLPTAPNALSEVQQAIKMEDRDSTPVQQAGTPHSNPMFETTSAPPPPPPSSTIQETIEETPVMEAQTLKAIEAIKNEHGLRAGRSGQPGSTEPASSEVDPSEKGTAPAKAKSATKKGVAKKPPSKRRKKESGTAPAKTAKATAKGKQDLKLETAPSQSTPVPQGTEDEDEGEGDESGSDSGSDQVYCVCRKKDDHSWMIACDGGCDDWFHGKCVAMKESEGPLIDKYICPNCTAAGHGVTTWKPMCRHPECRKPARLSKTQISKYCSDECGVRFMQIMTRRAGVASGEVKLGRARKRGAAAARASLVNGGGGGNGSSDEDEPSPRGGALNLASIKRLIMGVQSVNEFRHLGNKVPRAPVSTIPSTTANANGEASTGPDPIDLSMLSPTDQARLDTITESKDKLRNRMTFLKDREKFIAESKEQAARYAERESIKVKDFCGFDHRLSWSERDFKAYRDRVNGVKSPLNMASTTSDQKGDAEQKTFNGAEPAAECGTPGAGPPANDDDDDDYSNLCTKKRCDKHKQWQKIMLQDVRFDESELADRMRDLDRMEVDIRERGSLMWAKERVQVGSGAGAGLGNTVEIVG